jgi:Ca2+-binding RTX toxin-like protein
MSSSNIRRTDRSTRTTFARTDSSAGAPKKSATAKKKENADGVRTAQPTLETSLTSRRIRGADPTTHQLRQRIDDSLSAGDNPSGRQRNTIQKRGPASAEAAALLGREKKREGFHENRDGSYTFNGGRGDDHYQVTHRADGSVVVRNEDTGKKYTLSGDDARQGVTINAGGGDDHLEITREPASKGGSQAGLTIEGGSGDDHISAKGTSGPIEIRGGSGDDHLEGGDGDDELDGGGGDDHLVGGKGMDALAGGDGDDHLEGGRGNDQVLGQGGDDHVAGGGGEDLIMGGEGADAIDGGAGGDAIYADREDTSIDAGSAGKFPIADLTNDIIVSEEGSVAAQNLRDGDAELHYDPEATEEYLRDHPELVIDGSDDFVARTQADLGVMLSTEQGRGLLGELTAALRDKGETMKFVEKPNEAGGSQNSGQNTVRVGMWAEMYDDGSNRAPLPVLFHEMVHQYQDLVSGYPEGKSTFEGGHTTNNLEREATGLSWIDEDGDYHPADELPFTDNQFRRELGLVERTEYGNVGGEPTGYAEDGGGRGGDEHDHSEPRRGNRRAYTLA